jgi:hypothetical protein
VFLSVLSVSSTHAATYTVTTTDDLVAGSLRDAITQANATPDDDVINFAVNGTGFPASTTTSWTSARLNRSLPTPLRPSQPQSALPDSKPPAR